MSETYLLIRRTPLGKIMSSGPFTTIGHAAVAAARTLTGAGMAGSGNARLFADALAILPLGTVKAHLSGYDFRILAADYTEDGAPITPGLRVFNYYDQTWGHIDAAPFMAENPAGPGGKFFNGWYDFTKDGDDRSCKMLNGQRLATKKAP